MLSTIYWVMKKFKSTKKMDEGERSASSPGHLTHAESFPIIHWAGLTPGLERESPLSANPYLRHYRDWAMET